MQAQLQTSSFSDEEALSDDIDLSVEKSEIIEPEAKDYRREIERLRQGLVGKALPAQPKQRFAPEDPLLTSSESSDDSNDEPNDKEDPDLDEMKSRFNRILANFERDKTE